MPCTANWTPTKKFNDEKMKKLMKTKERKEKEYKFGNIEYIIMRTNFMGLITMGNWYSGINNDYFELLQLYIQK